MRLAVKFLRYFVIPGNPVLFEVGSSEYLFSASAGDSIKFYGHCVRCVVQSSYSAMRILS